MATFGSYKNSVNPRMQWSASYSYTRTSNTNVRVTMTVTGEIINHSYDSWMGTNSTDNAWIDIVAMAGAVTQTYRIKTSSEVWRGNSNNPRSHTFTLDVYSNIAGQSIGVAYRVDTGTAYVTPARVPTQSTSFSAPALLYTACSAPTSVTANKSVAISGSTVKISWSGAKGGTNNSITGYEVQWSTGSGWQTLGSYTGTSATKTFYDADVGKTCYFRVRTKGSAGSSYYSGWTGKKAPVLINTPPTVSGLGCNKTLIKTTGETVRFSWNGSDSNGHGLTYYYVLNTSSSTNPTTSNSKTTNKYVNLASGASATRYFHVRAWDGYEYSSTLHLKLNYNSLPTAPKVTPNWTSNKVVDSVTMNFSSTDANGQSLTYYIYRQVSSSTSFSGASNTLVTTTTSKSYTDPLTPYSTYAGKYVRYRIRAYDGMEYGSYSSYTVAARKNINPNPAISMTISPSIFENSVSISWETPAMTTSGRRNIYIQKSISSNQTFTTWSNVTTIDVVENPGETYTDSTNLPSRGYYVKYRMRYSDSLGYYSSYKESNVIKRNTAPTLDGVVTLDFSGTYYPWRKNSMNISWNAAVSDDDSGGQAKKYSLYLNIPGFTRKIILNKATMTITGGEITQKLDFVQNNALTSLITSIITTNSRRNELYTNCYFTIIAYDSYNVASSSVTKYFNMDFRESPVLPNQSSGIGNNQYYYFTNNVLGRISENNSNEDGEILYNQTTNNYPMLNAGEQLIITWPKGTDKNNGTVSEDDITEYTIKRLWGESVGSLTDTHNESEYSTLVTLKTSELTSDSSGKYNYIYTIPTISTNRVVKLGIVATDTTGKKSNFVKFPYGVELCRTVNPTLELNNISFGDSISDTQRKIVADVTIADIGGSSIDSRRTGISYANRRNLERILSARNISMQIQYSENINFDNFQTISLYSRTNTPYEYNMTNREIETTTGIDFKKTYFVRILFQVYNAPSSSRTSYSNVLMLRGQEPPYSFRKMGLGINNSSPDGRLHVKAIESDENKEVVIFGDSNTAGTQRFIVSLLSGKLLAGIIDSGELT